MTEAILAFVHDAMASPWIYVVIVGLALLDAFFPIVPSETVVVTAGVFAASTGHPALWLVVVAAAVGAFVGDHISYWIGRTAGHRLLDKIKPGTKRRAAYEWATKSLRERGGLVLVVARYIPGGRTAVTLVMGSTAYPAKRFAFFDAIAAVSWGLYGALVGYLGGMAFENDPIKGVILGVGLAIGVTVAVELVRYVLKRRRSGPEATGAESEPGEQLPEPAGTQR
jgi:membrane protein DedA with SNARE-associated domain